MFKTINEKISKAINDRVNSGDITPGMAMALNFFLNIQKVHVFEKRSVSDLISGYTDQLIALIDQKKPGLFKNGNFSLLNGVK